MLRAMSDVQEAAQILCGSAFPEAVLKTCFSELNSRVGALRAINVSPYDGHFERAVMKHHLQDKKPRIASLSLTNDLDIGEYVQQVAALEVLQAYLP